MTTRIASGKPRPDKETRPIVSAGGVLFDARDRVLLLRRADEGIWCFPKGRIEAGETPQEAAAREILEESGLRCEIGKKVGETGYVFYWPPDDVNYDKRVVWFLARPLGGDVRLEDRFDDWRWTTPARGLRLLHHGNDRGILRKALRAAGLTGRI